MKPINPARSTHPFTPGSYEDFEVRLVRALGATIGGETLSRTLGYPTQDAFRKAHARNRLPVNTFEIAGRRGRFASTVDIAVWLWAHRAAQTVPVHSSALEACPNTIM
jgi:hypothetical protein